MKSIMQFIYKWNPFSCYKKMFEDPGFPLKTIYA